jgi:type II secretory pathway predicted ATPase ExeA
LLVVGPTGSGKTSALRAFSDQDKCPVVNVGVELSRRLLELTERQRIIELPSLLAELVEESKRDVVILDNTEILFNPVLKQDPLRLLMGLSRNRTVVVSWLGVLDGQFLTYATPEHPEFRRYPSEGLLVVTLVGSKG